MLAFTRDVECALEWFRWTHELTDHGWRRTALPRDGGLAKQDARLMHLLEEVRLTANAVMEEQRDDAAHARDVEQWRETKRAELTS